TTPSYTLSLRDALPILEAAGRGMDREQLIQRLRARVRRGGPAEQVWWNGELVHVSEAIVRAAELSDNEQIRARGDDVVIPRQLGSEEHTSELQSPYDLV